MAGHLSPRNPSPPCLETRTSSLTTLPYELSTLALTSFASPGTLLKLSTVCKRLKPLSRLAVEENPSPYARYLIGLSMLGRRDGFDVEVRFHRPRALRILEGLTCPASFLSSSFKPKSEASSSAVKVRQTALLALAKEYAASVSCSVEATNESRRHGVELTKRAYGCALLEPARDDDGVRDRAVEAARDVADAFETGGMGVESDFGQHTMWLGKAADLGCLESMCDLALCWEMGDSTKDGAGADDRKAFQIYLLAAEAAMARGEECDEAFASVAQYYEEGRAGVVQDHWKAVEWYRRGGCGECRRGRKRLRDVDRIFGSATVGAMEEA